MNFLALLRTPFPRPKKSKRNLLGLILVGVCCSLFIILYKPFGIKNVNGQWYYDLIILSMGVLFVLSVLLAEWGIPSLFPQAFKNWNLGKAILWYTTVALFIGAVIFLYKSYLSGFHEFTFAEYLFVIGRVIVITLTVSFFVLGIHQYINRQKISRISNQEEYLIKAQNGKSIKLNLQDILYIASNDNYVDLHLISETKRKKILFRSSLKNVEAQIVNPLSPIFRCHRGYLININYFEIHKKTSRSMMLSLRNYPDEIPVSQKYAASIQELLHVHP